MLSDWDKTVFTTDLVDGKPLSHDVYTKGAGPVVLIIQELPGIGVETLRLADDLIAAGFSVVMPHLFGPLGKFSIVGNVARLFCMRREFALFARHKTSPVVAWLAALCDDTRKKHQVRGIGVIGMCLTGNFAISLMADDAVLAGVAAQPSLPLFGPDALHMSDQDIAEVRGALDEKGAMIAMRFKGDKACTAAKFNSLDAAFNDDRQRIRLNTLPGDKHSILTGHFVDREGTPTHEALQEVIAYFTDKLNAIVQPIRSATDARAPTDLSPEETPRLRGA